MKHIVIITIILAMVVGCGNKDNGVTAEEVVPTLVINTHVEATEDNGFGRTYDYGETIKLSVDVIDEGYTTIKNNVLWYMEPEEGTIIGLGEGTTLSLDNLDGGQHTIKAIYKNSDGKVGEDLIIITVNGPKRQKEISSGQAYAWIFKMTIKPRVMI